MFNWFRRNEPPPGIRHHKALAEFFNGEQIDYVLYGKLYRVQNPQLVRDWRNRQQELNKLMTWVQKLLYDRDSQVDIALLNDEIKGLRHQVEELRAQVKAKASPDVPKKHSNSEVESQKNAKILRVEAYEESTGSGQDIDDQDQAQGPRLA